MKVTFVLLVTLTVLAVDVTAEKKGEKKCVMERDEAISNNERPPTCTKDGYYKRKQCNDEICWCVKKKSGKPNHGGQLVPLGHDYNCRRKPKACLKEELDILLDNPFATEPELPQCDRKGWYKPKQCKKAKCKGGRNKRATPVVPACGTLEEFGFGGQGVTLDTADEWTMVLDDPFTEDGEITGVEFYAGTGAAGRPLRVGIYRPTANTCQFILKQQIELSGIVDEHNLFEFDNGDRLQLLAGDFVGFSWTHQGVVTYNDSADYNYCEDDEVFDEQDVATLMANRHGNREYGIRFFFDASSWFIGYEPQDRSNVDSGLEWTFVDKNPFPGEGEVRAIELWARATGRPLYVGIYRPTGDPAAPNPDCEFTLEKKWTLTDFALGFNRTELSSSETYEVNEGDHLGFSWDAQGVVAYDNDGFTNHFCEGSGVYDESDTVTLDDTYGQREYSIQLEIDSCDTPLYSGSHVSAKGRDCVKCFCVDKKTGEKVVDPNLDEDCKPQEG